MDDNDGDLKVATASNNWVVIAGAAESLTDRLPPVVVGSSIATGSLGVAPGRQVLRVDFSEPILNEAWSVVEYAPGSAPGLAVAPRLEQGGRSLVLELQLEPSRKYAFWLNTAQHQNFRDRDGMSLVPYLIGFQTSA